MSPACVPCHQCPSCHFAERERLLVGSTWPIFEREVAEEQQPCINCGALTFQTTGARLPDHKRPEPGDGV